MGRKRREMGLQNVHKTSGGERVARGRSYKEKHCPGEGLQGKELAGGGVNI